MIELADGDARAVLVPEAGGAVARFTWRGLDILRPAPESAIVARRVREMGCYPLVPYANRIGHGRLHAGSNIHRLRPNFPPEPHAIHGVGWQRAWRVTESSATRAVMTLSQVPDADWPFRFACTQRFELRDARLEASLDLLNTDEVPFPAGLGFHPFFPAPPGTRLRTAWTGCWALDASHLPFSRCAVPPEADFREARAVDGWRVDSAFTGWSREASLAYPTHETRLTADEALDHAVAYAPQDGRAFLALEPMSHTIDAFALSARGIGGTGTRHLRPGEAWRVSMAIEARTAPR
jgi:aldose 1-epimerase